MKTRNTTQQLKTNAPVTWSSLPVDELRPAQLAAGPCPHCGRIDTWLNDVPLRAFCWGQPGAEHREWSRTVPARYNRYSPRFDPDAPQPQVGEIEVRAEMAAG